MSRFKRGDVLLTLTLLIVSLAIVLMGLRRPEGTRAVVVVNGRKVAVLPLDQPAHLAVKGPLGETVLEVDDRGIHVLSSPCPHKTCIRMGHAHVRGQAVICVPNRISIRIEGGDEGVDAVSG